MLILSNSLNNQLSDKLAFDLRRLRTVFVIGCSFFCSLAGVCRDEGS